MKESYSEGVVLHTGPESCVDGEQRKQSATTFSMMHITG